MNLVLGTLAELKVMLLAESLRSGTDYDGTLAAIGLGVARAFESACGRKLGRVEGDTFEFMADVQHVVVPRYPLEAVTALALRETLAAGWVDQGTITDTVEQLSEFAGIVYFGSRLAPRPTRARLTYTGGYWIDESGDGTIDNRSAVQQGSAALSTNDESKAISFGVTFASAPKVLPVVVPPSGGLIISAVPQSITTSGFTALLGFPIPASGYTLSYIAVAANAATSGGAMPSGATALPDDLKLAWLLQCQLVWNTIDALGVGIGGGKAKEAAVAALSGLELVPEVRATLALYRRMTLA